MGTNGQHDYRRQEHTAKQLMNGNVPRVRRYQNCISQRGALQSARSCVDQNRQFA